MSARVLDDFLTELRGAAAGRLPEHIETLEEVFHALKNGDTPLAIADHDRICAIIRRPLPLIARIHAVLMLLQHDQ
jgi:hypothetical protein